MKYAKRRVTMSDIAARLGVSKNSISLALSEKPGVSDDLRKKIIRMAEEMNYKGHIAQVPVKIRYILLVMADYLRNDAYFYADIFWSIEKEAKLRDCITINISVSQQDVREGNLPDLPVEMEIAGILAVGILSRPYIKQMQSLGLPLLTVDILYHNLQVGGIATSNVEGGHMATEYLIRCGHRDIGFMGPIFTAQSVYERWCGFRQAMDEAGFTVRDDFNVMGRHGCFELFDTEDALAPYFNQILEHPTAWFCAGDRIAVALMNLLRRKGVNVPDEISVIGFDDIPLAQMTYPQLTTVRVNRALMGKLAVERLLDRKDDYPETITYGLSGMLVERDSVRNINIKEKR